ncbi:MAG: PqqD family protein [Deltaproteobacteria bacterium]|nr:MAG: PqqD family protein [Deltaproteobacteria bacterium]
MDEVVFVVTPDDQRLHELNETAALIWECAAAGCTAEDAARAIVEQYEVDLDTALADVRACCEDLVNRKILVAEPA